MEIPKKRCAIYTRKSHEEGLEQEFNSLHAQRGAAESYILSQRHEGWEALATEYNDGGFSGGNLDRPALNRLIEDIKSGYIDIIVVYKIDRLSRSLMDFSKIIELLDEHGVSFVSVTESFNTSSSTGRLMLNILLSFAQYERELTSERIRDKFKSSSQKGYWMGGPVPLGYEVEDRKLLINEEEAERVRYIYQCYAQKESLSETLKDLHAKGMKSKSWLSRSGIFHEGKPFIKSTLLTILTNPVYAGFIKHKGDVYDGLHEAIIEPDFWKKVQNISKKKTKVSKPNSRVTSSPLLQGIFECGVCEKAMTSTYTKKKSKHYRYYICSNKNQKLVSECHFGNIPAGEVEEAVVHQVLEILSKPEMVAKALIFTADELPANLIIENFRKIRRVWDELFPVEQSRIVNLLIRKVLILDKGLEIIVNSSGLSSLCHEVGEVV